MDRRGFLKTLVGGAGAVVAGRFVIHDPVVLAGDLIAPNPEPTLIHATTMPERIDYAADAFLTDWEVTSDPLGYSRWGNDARQYPQGLMTMTCRLTITSDIRHATGSLMKASKVRLYVIDQAIRRM